MTSSPDRPRDRDLDLVLWGATGFTGRLTALYLAARLAGDAGGPSRSLAWALGGRDRDKLRALRDELAAVDPAARELPLLVGDSLDPDTLAPLVGRTRVVATTVGPYSRYGTPLVRLCAVAGTDYCDLSGEVPWMRRTVDAFHDTARRSGARIVHCCGFDSIPSDLGVLLLHRRLEEEGDRLRRARLRVGRTEGGFSGGTVASMFEVLEEARKDKAVRRLLADPWALVPKEDRRPRSPGGDDGRRGRGAPEEDRRRGRDDDRGVWTAPFLMAGINTRVVRRTNALLGHPYGEDFEYDERVDAGRGLSGRLRSRVMTLGLGAFTAAAALPPTGWAMRRFILPDPGEGPSAEEREAGSFLMRIFGEGARGARARIDVAADRDPGYGATSRMLAEAALCLARDEAARSEGGVLTPASALGEPVVPRLEEAGITFTAGE